MGEPGCGREGATPLSFCWNVRYLLELPYVNMLSCKGSPVHQLEPGSIAGTAYGMPDYSKIYLYRMVHKANIPHIIEQGLTHRDSPRANPAYIPIGDSSLIDVRNDRKFLPNNRYLSEFIAFYFAPRMPMLYVIQHGYNSVPQKQPSEIVYIITTIERILQAKLNFLFTDGHAVSEISRILTPDKISELEQYLDFQAIKSLHWNLDPDFKRRKQAEFLVDGDISFETIAGFGVYDQETALELEALPVNKPIVVKPDWYF